MPATCGKAESVSTMFASVSRDGAIDYARPFASTASGCIFGMVV